MGLGQGGKEQTGVGCTVLGLVAVTKARLGRAALGAAG